MGEDPWVAYPQMVSCDLEHQECLIPHGSSSIPSVHLPKLSQPSTIWLFKILHKPPQGLILCVWCDCGIWFQILEENSKSTFSVLNTFTSTKWLFFAIVTPGCPFSGNLLLVLLLFFPPDAFVGGIIGLIFAYICYRQHYPPLGNTACHKSYVSLLDQNSVKKEERPTADNATGLPLEGITEGPV